MKYLYIWLIIINIITFVVFGIDKKKAIDGKFRISESVLFLLSLLGGSLGGFIAMHTFHHKTRKWYFKLGIPLILVAWSALIAWLVLKTQYDFRTLKACLSGCFSLQTYLFVCQKPKSWNYFR